MTSIKETLKAARRRTAHDNWFIPEARMRCILNRETVTQRLSECHIPLELLDETLELIMTKATKVFAILIRIEQESLVVDLIANDILNNKLPLGTESVEGLELDAKFFDIQWEFVAPIFTRRSVVLKLKYRHVLPYLEDRKIDNVHGGYANAFRVVLDPQHQDVVEPTKVEQVSRERQDPFLTHGVPHT
jgi:hypothetical protein